MFSFGIKGGLEAGKVHRQSQDVQPSGEGRRCAQFGDSSVVTTHQQLSRTQQEAAGVTEDLVRLSVGLEDIEDILWDLDQALAASQARAK